MGENEIDGFSKNDRTVTSRPEILRRVRFVLPAIVANGQGAPFRPNGQRKWIMAEGTVRWFSINKGFGYIERLRGKDVLVYSVAIVGEGEKSLSEGDAVQFDTVQGPTGPHAANVRKLDFTVPDNVNSRWGLI